MGFRWTRGQDKRQIRAVFALLALLVGWIAGGPAAAATAVRSVAVGDGRIDIRFDGPVGDATGTILPDTRQIAVDIAGVTPGLKTIVGGPVRAVRQLVRGTGTRLVFDLARPAVIGDGGFDADGRRLTLSLQVVDVARFAAASAAGPLSFLSFDFANWTARPKYKVSIPVPPPARGVKLPRVQGDDDRPLVVIDAGHGGVDPGAINPDTGLREKDVTLRIAKAIRDQLLASGRVRVALTRDDDRYLVLRERFGIARRLHANLFISIHCDSVGSGDASGASVYTLSEVASDKEAARLATRENKADVISGVNLGDAGADVSSILIDLTQRETMNSSASFARLLGREAKPLIPTKANFHRMASLMVLKAPDMPSILFETGYISNPGDAAFLDSREGRDKIAESVTRAVEVHFARQMASK
ncbi:N-acetylmuramoyl-L-alanine amidase family protein [Sphingomonas sp. XXL09]|uniref:N-acetylmuramoyl-L-alanine amidase family protein n=1 Tax=Sphingomonas sp. XXL09 TaxID=3457787 RepID=UPI00406BCD36